ncbi:MAG: malonate decarboxylase holo-ACP synthase, partial [Pseudomonadota bacterium]|nr:malonate decarboxylase holo-ACP synthase [Pseudomonadota bacterium]
RDARYAACVDARHIAAIVSPEQLLTRQCAAARRTLPAMTLLASLQPWFADQCLAGGPAGSTGFELASGQAVVHQTSDLDLLLRPAQRFSVATAQRWCASLQAQAGAAGCRIDVQVESGHGAFALAEYAAHQRVLLRTPHGVYLTGDPWSPSL